MRLNYSVTALSIAAWWWLAAPTAMGQSDPRTLSLTSITWTLNSTVVGQGKHINFPNPVGGQGGLWATLNLPDVIREGQGFTSFFSLSATNALTPWPWDMRIIGWGGPFDFYDNCVYGQTNPVNISASGVWAPVYDYENDSYNWTVQLTAWPCFRDGSVVKTFTRMPVPAYPLFRMNLSGNGGSPLSANVTYTLQPPPADQPQIDQKYAARETGLHVTIRGQNFGADTTPAFLMPDTSADADIVVSNVKVTSSTLVEADIFVSPDAELGPRLLRVHTGGSDSFKTNALDVIALTLEVNQGAVTARGADRVANHPTVIRAFVEDPRRIRTVRGTLCVFNGGKQIPGSPFYPSVPLNNQDENYNYLAWDYTSVRINYADVDRYYLRDSLNFLFGNNVTYGTAPQLPAGSFSFVLAMSPTDPSSSPYGLIGLTKDQLLARTNLIVYEDALIHNFKTTKSLRVLALVDYRLHPGIINRTKVGLKTTQSYFGALFPLDGMKVRVSPASFSRDVFDIDALQPRAYNYFACWYARVWAKLTSLLEEHNRLFSANYQCDWVAMVSSGLNVSQIAEDPETGGITDLQTGAIITSDSMTTFAHELGHAYGLGDTYNPPSYANLVNPRRFDAPPDGNPVEDGAVRLFPIYDSGKNRPLIAVTACVAAPGGPPPIWGVGTSYQRTSQMGVSNDENARWFDRTEWNHLLGQFRAGLASPKSPVGFLTVGGAIDVAGNLAELEVINDPNGAKWVPTEPGDYWLDQLDTAGTVLSSEGFGVNFYGPARGITTETAFRVSAPLETGCSKVQLRHGTKVLFSRAVSAHTPAVAILSPAGGETVNAPFELRWSASDTDGDALTFSVYYLRDGVEPSVIARNLATNSFHWDPSMVAGSTQARIAIAASDGFNEGVGTSAAFTVTKKGPVVTILSPSDGIAVPSGDTVALIGGGFDPEDGYLPDSAFTFSSDLQGTLYPLHNSVIEASLSEGVHTITLSGVDSDGNTNQTSITVTVGDPDVVPALDSLTPTSGPPGTAVTITGRNLLATNTLVLFGTNAAPISSLTATQCVVHVPAGLSLGKLGVSVVIGDFRTETTGFTALAGRPVITSVQPRGGPPGTSVVLRVAELDPATNLVVRFGGTATPVLDVEGQDVMVAVPATLAPGLVAITISNALGTSDPAAFQVTNGIPLSVVVLDSVSPAMGQAGTHLTIRGNGFSTVFANNVVSFGSVKTFPLSVTTNSLDVLIPPGIPQGPVPVFVSVDGYPSNPLWLTVSPSSADLAISQISHVTAAGLAFTITVENLGPGDATGLKITDSLPPGTAVLSAASTIGACSVTNRLLTCAINQLINGGAAVVTLQLAVATPGLYTNVADVRGVEPDPVLSNNLARQVVQFTAPSPVLLIEFTGNSVRISWPATTPANVVLQTSPSLSPTSWADVPDAPANVNGRFQVTQSIANQSHYYRLLIR